MAKDSPLRLILAVLAGMCSVIFFVPAAYPEVWKFLEAYPPTLPGALLHLVNITALGLLMTSVHFFWSFKVE